MTDMNQYEESSRNIALQAEVERLNEALDVQAGIAAGLRDNLTLEREERMASDQEVERLNDVLASRHPSVVAIELAETQREVERLRKDIEVYVKTRDAMEVENEQLAADLGRARNDLLRVEAEVERLREERETLLDQDRTNEVQRELERLREVIYTYHEWLERHEQENRPEHPGEPRRGYIGLDHRVGENAAGCSGCAALGEA